MISLLKRLLCRHFKSEHEKWLIRRLPYIMGFKDPKLFDLVEYQKEGLLVLMASAHSTREAWEKYSKRPTDSKLESGYQALRNLYTYDVQTLQQAHPVFKDLEIHWSKLSDFIRKWQMNSPTKLDQKATNQLRLFETT